MFQHPVFPSEPATPEYQITLFAGPYSIGMAQGLTYTQSREVHQDPLFGEYWPGSTKCHLTLSDVRLFARFWRDEAFTGGSFQSASQKLPLQIEMAANGVPKYRFQNCWLLMPFNEPYIDRAADWLCLPEVNLTVECAVSLEQPPIEMPQQIVVKKNLWRRYPQPQ